MEQHVHEVVLLQSNDLQNHVHVHVHAHVPKDRDVHDEEVHEEQGLLRFLQLLGNQEPNQWQWQPLNKFLQKHEEHGLQLHEDHDGHQNHVHVPKDRDVHEEEHDVRSDEEELNELWGLHEDDEGVHEEVHEGQEQQRF